LLFGRGGKPGFDVGGSAAKRRHLGEAHHRPFPRPGRHSRGPPRYPSPSSSH
jgi:hypothetical protein